MWPESISWRSQTGHRLGAISISSPRKGGASERCDPRTFTGAFRNQTWVDEKRAPGCLGLYRGLYYPIIWGFLISQYKDPHSPTSIMESRSFFFVAHMSRWNGWRIGYSLEGKGGETILLSMAEIRLTSWYMVNIPLFTGIHTCQAVCLGFFFHQQHGWIVW